MTKEHDFTHQTLVSHEHKFLYQPIPKSACRTIKSWMILLHKKSDVLKNTLSNYDDEIPTGLMYDKFNDELNKNNVDVHGLCRDVFPTLNLEKNINDYFKFAFVRNPWIRVAAAYQEKFKHPIHGLYYKPAIDFNDFILKSVGEDSNYFDKNGVLTFNAFINILFANKGSTVQDYENLMGLFDVHWMPQWWYIDYFLDGKCDFIGKLETMEDSFKLLIKEINVDFYPKFKIGGTKKIEFYKSMYENQEMIDMVGKIYEEDIERFNYNF